MNIDSVSTASVPSPPRAEGVQQTGRSPATQGRQAVSPEQARTSPVAQNRQADADRGGDSPSREDVAEAVDRLAGFVAPNQSDINFSVDESSGVRVVKIIDRNSNEVIRQMPSEEAVALARALDKLQGLLIKDKA